MLRVGHRFVVGLFVGYLFAARWATNGEAPSRGLGVATQARCWKGNTHTHTLWSDGDMSPEIVTEFYREHGYDFLVLSDHNILSKGERWYPIGSGEGNYLTPARVEELREKFGTDWVEVRERVAKGSGSEMRLKTLDELRAKFDSPGEILFIQGEEITDRFEKHPAL